MATDNIIDISTAINGTQAQRKAVADEIGSALEHIGGMVVSGHGISQELIDETRTVFRDFYQQPAPYKRQFQRPDTESVARGYTCRDDVVSSSPNIERFSVGDFEVGDSDYYQSTMGRQYFPANILPDQPNNFVDICKTYFNEVKKFSMTMFELFELCLDSPRGYFTDNLQRSSGNLTAIHYQSLGNKPQGKFLIQEHTDSGGLTVLNTQATLDSGLQFLSTHGEWEDIQPSENHFVVNVGDLLHRWSNGRWLSTVHRVMNPKPENAHIPRISVVYFEHPDYRATINSFTRGGEQANFKAVNSGEFEYMKRLKIHLMNDAQITAMLDKHVAER